MYTAQEVKVVCQEYGSLKCDIEEADTRMIYHLIHQCQPQSNVVVRSSDTDVLMILLGNYHKFAEDIHIWMETGKQGDNSLRYIDINEIAKEIGDTLVGGKTANLPQMWRKT